MSSVLVTGGAGYIGSHACQALAAAGWVPVTYDNLSTGWADAVQFGPFEEGDLADRARLDDVFARHRPVAVLHFAALSDVGEAARIPGRYWRENAAGALTLIEASVAAGCLGFVFSSTCAVYGDQGGDRGGDQGGGVLDESAPVAPLNAYAASKRAVEDMLRDFAASHGLRHVILRYFNAAGADPGAAIGEHHRPETHLIPVMLDAALGRRPPLAVHGTDYDTRDGTCIRDYVHVADLATAHLAGLRWLAGGGGNGVFNLGTGHGFSVREVLAAGAAVTGTRVPQEDGPRRAGDAARLVSGGDAAARVLGWRPEHSTLETMIADAWRWHRSGHYTR